MGVRPGSNHKFALALALTIGCGGKVEHASRDETPAGGGSPSGADDASGTMGGAGGSMDPAELTPGGFPRCGTLDPDRADACDDLDLIVPSGPSVSLFTDGSIEPGWTSSVSVYVENHTHMVAAPHLRSARDDRIFMLLSRVFRVMPSGAESAPAAPLVATNQWSSEDFLRNLVRGQHVSADLRKYCVGRPSA
jgi:hypothetical protein